MYPPEPSEPPTWESHDELSRPDPAAYAHAYLPELDAADALHATHPIGDAASVPLYPADVSAPPPPPSSNASTPTFFPMLYPTQPHTNRAATLTTSAVGVIIGMVSALLLIACLGLFAWQRGFFQQFFGGSASHSSTTSSATPTLVLGGIAATKTPVVRVTTTPGVLVTVTPGPQPTANPTTTPTSGLTPTPLVSVTPGPSPTPTLTPNPSPTPTFTATPTATATATATPVPLTVAITCLSAQDHQSATMCVQTRANAALTISVIDGDGQIDNNAPTSGTADGSGYYTDTWQPRKAKGPNHTVTVTVTAMLNGQQASDTKTFTVS